MRYNSPDFIVEAELESGGVKKEIELTIDLFKVASKYITLGFCGSEELYKKLFIESILSLPKKVDLYKTMRLFIEEKVYDLKANNYEELFASVIIDELENYASKIQTSLEEKPSVIIKSIQKYGSGPLETPSVMCKVGVIINKGDNINSYEELNLDIDADSTENDLMNIVSKVLLKDNKVNKGDKITYHVYNIEKKENVH